MAWMPGASRVQTFSGNRHKATIDKIIIHTTEGSNWPGYAGGGNAPHFTSKHTGSIRQHIDTAYSSKALVNRSGGVQTNNAGVIQVENIGSCDRAYANRHGLFFWPDADDDDLMPLARILAWVHEEHGVPLTVRNLVWSDSNAAYATAPQRMSYQEWRDFTGVAGHQHVPENDHWDPGKMPVWRAVELARDLVGKSTVAHDPARPWRTSDRVAGMSEAEVREIQGILLGFDLDLGHWGADGSYGDATGTAVQTLQTELELTADGIFGPSTQEAYMTIKSDISDIKRAIEPGISGKRTDGELVATLRGFRNDLPDMILDDKISLAGSREGVTSSARKKLAWMDHERDRQNAAIAGLSAQIAGLSAAVTALAEGGTIDLDAVRAAAAEGAREGGVDVSAEDVAALLEVTVQEG